MMRLGIFALVWSALSAPSPPEWWEHALRLTGESDAVRRRAVSRLEKIPNLDSILKKALNGDKQALAIDTIVALEKKQFLPKLMSLSLTDPTGVTLLAVNHFLDSDNGPRVATWFRKRLRHHEPAPVAQIIWDTLGRMGAVVPLHEVRSQTRQVYEVVDGVVNYVRLMVLNHRKSEYLDLVGPLMKHPAYQIRLRTAYFIGELPPEWRQGLTDVLNECASDPHPEVSARCRKGGGQR